MSSLKTILLVGGFIATATPSMALGPLHYVFAECVGRFSAEMEHAWLLGNPDAEDLQNQRHSFLSLMEATTPKGEARLTLAHRIDHKIAHAALLTTASFGENPKRARSARAIALSYRENCERLLLDS